MFEKYKYCLNRYFLQAEDQLDCNWLFMKATEDDDASWFNWLLEQL